MPHRTWDTRTDPEAGFEDAWNAILSGTPHAHFEVDLRFVRWEAAHGRHALAATLEDGSRRGVLVLKRTPGGLRSGWPWRWNMVLASPSRPGPVGLDPEDVDWFFGHANRIAGGERLECHVPALGAETGSEFTAGATIIRSVEQTDAELLASMDGDKRRAGQRARREGFEVVEAADVESMRAFARLQIETERRRGIASAEEADPVAGEAHREWELPWMWLLLAVRDGKVEAGSGFGRVAGARVDYRANASTDEARKLGANSLLAYEAMRRSRDQGCRWLNWCGANRFKRDLGGEVIPIRRRLGGGALWAVPNVLISSGHRLRDAVARAVREQRARKPAAGGPRPARKSEPRPKS